MIRDLFQPFTVKDIVFLAILSAIATCTASIMAVVSQIHIFGLAQVVTALQYSLFPAVALMKVRKVGTILFFSVFTGVIELFMSPMMFFSSLFSGIVIEALVVFVFKGYQSDKVVHIAAWLFIPLTMPANYLYYIFVSAEAYNRFFGEGFQIVILVCVVAAIVLSAFGSWLGVKISRELKRAGVLKA